MHRHSYADDSSLPCYNDANALPIDIRRRSEHDAVMNPVPLPAGDLGPGSAALRRLGIAVALLFFGVGLWLVVLATIGTFADSYEKPTITTSGSIVLGSNAALVVVLAVGLGLVLKVRRRSCRVVLRLCGVLCLCTLIP